ncbi:MAG: dihydrodipicolinate synthase family protein [Alphaproteobacteria bacterium]|nr:dihydrodipicolinate synthase family protein [Alphaproteobacteria bacterium]
MANFSSEDVRHGISGPVFPLVTPFTEEGDVDHSALAKYVEFLTSCGAKTIMTTVGTSRFNLLIDDEIRQVNNTVCCATSPRTVTIVAGPMTGNLRTNIEFAQHAETIGADAYIAFFPERWYGEDQVYDFFQRLSASVSIAVMIHEMPLRSGYGGQKQYPIDLLERLVSIPNLVGMKEECMDGGYAYLLHRRLQGQCAVIGAGAMRNFMRDFHAGGRANLAGVGSFFPRVEMAFQEALRSGDTNRAHHIVRTYEDPYFDVAVELGWHPQLKETMSVLGLMPAYERAPLPRLNKDQRDRLLSCIENLGWLDLAPDHTPE